MKALFLSLLACFAFCGCDRYKVVNVELDEVIPKPIADKLRRDAEIGRGVGRYHIHKDWVRTWRLDTATGQVCLLLASEEDWKKPEVAQQACNNRME